MSYFDEDAIVASFPSVPPSPVRSLAASPDSDASAEVEPNAQWSGLATQQASVLRSILEKQATTSGTNTASRSDSGAAGPPTIEELTQIEPRDLAFALAPLYGDRNVPERDIPWIPGAPGQQEQASGMASPPTEVQSEPMQFEIPWNPLPSRGDTSTFQDDVEWATGPLRGEVDSSDDDVSELSEGLGPLHLRSERPVRDVGLTPPEEQAPDSKLQEVTETQEQGDLAQALPPQQSPSQSRAQGSACGKDSAKAPKAHRGRGTLQVPSPLQESAPPRQRTYSRGQSDMQPRGRGRGRGRATLRDFMPQHPAIHVWGRGFGQSQPRYRIMSRGTAPRGQSTPRRPTNQPLIAFIPRGYYSRPRTSQWVPRIPVHPRASRPWTQRTSNPRRGSQGNEARGPAPSEEGPLQGPSGAPSAPPAEPQP